MNQNPETPTATQTLPSPETQPLTPTETPTANQNPPLGATTETISSTTASVPTPTETTAGNQSPQNEIVAPALGATVPGETPPAQGGRLQRIFGSLTGLLRRK